MVVVPVCALIICVSVIYYMYQYNCHIVFLTIAVVMSVLLMYVVVKQPFLDTYLIDLLNHHGVDENIFSNTDGFIIAMGSKYKKHKTIYGEVYVRGIDNLYTYVRKSHPNALHVFMDLGSGVGKSVVAAKLIGFKHAIGIEVVTERHNQAEIVRKKLPKAIQKSVEFHVGDCRDFDFTRFDKPIVIFMSNLLWTRDTNEEMYHIIADKCPPGTLVVSSICNIHPKDESRFKHETRLNLPMSWDPYSSCRVSRLL